MLQIPKPYALYIKKYNSSIAVSAPNSFIANIVWPELEKFGTISKYQLIDTFVYINPTYNMDEVAEYIERFLFIELLKIGSNIAFQYRYSSIIGA